MLIYSTQTLKFLSNLTYKRSQKNSPIFSGELTQPKTRVKLKFLLVFDSLNHAS